MPQGKGKASSSRRRSSDDHPHDGRPRLDSSFLSDGPLSAPSSSLDQSIPFNLPPRRSMKMLKDGTDFVWPEAAHSLFVRGLQAWKVMNIGSKRTRAPRGEGKTDFLVRFLESHGVERTKKQVASHLQVLRTEWRNSENMVLLSLVDDTVPHSRSLSEPSLPPPSPSNNSPTNSLSFFNPVPDHGDDRSNSTPSLPSPISTLPPPPSSSSLYHPAHDLYNSRRESVPSGAFHTQSGVNFSPWQSDHSVWHTAAASEQEPYSRPVMHYPVASYDPQSTFHDYDRTPRPLPPPALESRNYSSDYYTVPSRGSTPLSGPSAPLARAPHSLTSLPLDTRGPSYNTYNSSPTYPIPQTAPQPQNVYGNASMAFGTEPYPPHFSSRAAPYTGAGIAVDSGSSYDDGVEPFRTAEHVQQPQPQPHWVRPPATIFPRPSNTPKRRNGSPNQ